MTFRELAEEIAKMPEEQKDQPAEIFYDWMEESWEIMEIVTEECELAKVPFMLLNDRVEKIKKG